MSAPTPIPPRSASLPDTGWTGTPSALYEAGARQDLSKAKKGILFLIERLTRGLGKTKAPIPIRTFVKYLGIERAYVHQLLKELEEEFWIQIHRGKGRPQYEGIGYVTDKESRSKMFRCRDCGQVGQKKTVTGFTSTPHALLHIFAACSPALVSCLLAIGNRLFDLDEKTSSFVVVGNGRKRRPAWLAWSQADFAKKTDLCEDTIRLALREGIELGIILTQSDPDHPSRMLYSIDLAALKRLRPLPKRTCHQPKRFVKPDPPLLGAVQAAARDEFEMHSGTATLRSAASLSAFERTERPDEEDKANEVQANQPEQAEKAGQLPEIELTGKRYYGRCLLCQSYKADPEVRVVTRPATESRAGPEPSPAPKSSPNEKTSQELRELYDFLLPWISIFMVPLEWDLVRDIHAARQGCPIAFLERRFQLRKKYLLERAQHPRILVRLAAEAGQLFMQLKRAQGAESKVSRPEGDEGRDRLEEEKRLRREAEERLRTDFLVELETMGIDTVKDQIWLLLREDDGPEVAWRRGLLQAKLRDLEKLVIEKH